jgi:Short C-terminal domain
MLLRPLARRPIGRGGLIGTAARTAVVAGTATAVVGGVQRHQQARAEQAYQAQAYEQAQQEPAMAAAARQPVVAPAPAVQQPAGPAGGDNTIAELEQLAQLKQQGLLSDAEFAAAKTKVLGL